MFKEGASEKFLNDGLEMLREGIIKNNEKAVVRGSVYVVLASLKDLPVEVLMLLAVASREEVDSKVGSVLKDHPELEELLRIVGEGEGHAHKCDECASLPRCPLSAAVKYRSEHPDSAKEEAPN